jgi:HK97 family phage major capsid protein
MAEAPMIHRPGKPEMKTMQTNELVEKEVLRSEPLYRTFDLDRASINEEERTVELSFSSEEPVERWFGTEILDHSSGSVRLDRLTSSGPLLLDHQPSYEKHVGSVLSAKIDTKTRKGRALVRVADDRDDVWQRIKSGMCRCVSVGYRIHKMVEEKSSDDHESYRAMDWEPHEVSLVSIPADTTVGVGRAAEPESKTGFAIRVFTHAEEEPSMSKETETPEVSPESKRQKETPAVLSDDARQKAIDDERSRIAKITEVARKHDQMTLGEKAVREGWSLATFTERLLDELPGAKRMSVDDTKPAEIGLTEKEKRNFSFLRLIRAQVFGQSNPKMIEAASFEREVSDAAAKQYRQEPKGFLVPTDVLLYERPELSRDWRAAREMQNLFRVLTQGGANDGTQIIATELLASNFIELLRNNSALANKGITILDGLQGDIAIPRHTGPATAYWLATDETDITASTQTLDQVSMTPKNVGAMSIYTRQLLLQSSISVEQFVRNDIAMVLGLALDLAGLYGTGASGQPTGVSNTSGINAPTNFAAAVPTFAEVVAMETAVAVDNALFGSLSYLTDPTTRGGLKTQEKATNTGQFVWENDSMNGYRADVSTQVTAGDVFFGNWADLIQGMWGGLDVLVDPYSLSARMNTRVIAMLTADYAVRHPVSFAFNNDGA